MLAETQTRLEEHFTGLARERSGYGYPVYALEHGLEREEIEALRRGTLRRILAGLGTLNGNIGFCGSLSPPRLVTLTMAMSIGSRLPRACLSGLKAHPVVPGSSTYRGEAGAKSETGLGFPFSGALSRPSACR